MYNSSLLANFRTQMTSPWSYSKENRIHTSNKNAMKFYHLTRYLVLPVESKRNVRSKAKIKDSI